MSSALHTDSYNILPSIYQRMTDYMHAVGPDEACGAVFGKIDNGQQIIDHFQPIRNVAGNPRHTFRLDPASWISCSFNPELLGIFHSHPTTPALPSSEDLRQLQLFGEMIQVYIIGSMTDVKPDLTAYSVNRSDNGLYTLEQTTLHLT